MNVSTGVSRRWRHRTSR